MTAIDHLEPTRIDEPEKAQQYAEVLSLVASKRRPIIVQRGGADLAAVIPLEHLDLLRELTSRAEAEHLAERLDWDQLLKTSAPLADWLEGDEPKPF